MPHRRRRFLRTLGAVGTATLAAGCSGGGTSGGTQPDESTDTPTDEPADTPTDEPTEAPTDEPTDTSTPTASGARAEFPDYSWETLDSAEAVPATTIAMRGFQFHPLVATMPPGVELTVRNEDSAPHTVTVPALDVKKTVSAGGSTTFTVEQTGTFGYVCEFHPPDMLGQLVVEEGVETPTDDTPTASPVVMTPDGDDTQTPTPTPTETSDDGYY